MRTSKPRHLHQAGSRGEEERSQPVHRYAAAKAGLQQLGALTGHPLFDGDSTCSCHTGIWGASQAKHLFVHQCQQIATLSCAGGQCLWITTLLEVQHSWPRCQEDSNPAIPTAYRPAPFNVWFPTEMCHSMKLQLWVAQNPQARLCATRFHP